MIDGAPRRCVLAGALTAAAIGAPAVAAAQDAARAVRIDVAVSSRGAAVPVLDAKAFTITVNGAPREVIAAEPAIAPRDETTTSMRTAGGASCAATTAGVVMTAPANANATGI